MYVLQVVSGKEKEILNRLLDLGFKCLVPEGFRYRRTKGAWQGLSEIIFKGYVFVSMTWSAENYYKITSVDGVIRLLRADSTPLQLTFLEEEWIVVLDSLGAKPTTVELIDDKCFIKDGVLSKFETSIVKVDKHKRCALIEIMVLGETHKIELGIDIV